MSKHLVIAAGGTGGHMFPAQALAEEMLARGWTVALSTDDRGLRFAGGFPEAVERLATRAATPARGGVAGAVTAPARILAGAGDAAAAFRRRRPAVVAGFGGYPSLPALLAAWRIGAPRMIHEQNGVLGRVNRLFAKRVGALALGVEPVLNAPAGAPLIYTGNPLRRAALEHVGRAYAPPPPEGPINLLIFGGSQGARIFSRAIPGALAKAPDALRARLRITQQTRPEDQAETARAYAEAGLSAELAPFFEDMPRRIADAHLVISRAGASTVAELTAIGRPAILAPYPEAAADHQSANARAVSDAGGATLLPDARLREELEPTLRALAENPQRLLEMANAAKSLGRPDATERLAQLVENLAEGAAKGAASKRG